jgi:hypothetical protein
MALTHVYVGDPESGNLSLALTTSYLGSGNEIVIHNAWSFDIQLDDGTAFTLKTSDDGTNFSDDMVFAAGAVYSIPCHPSIPVYVDIKAAAGTPKATGRGSRRV